MATKLFIDTNVYLDVLMARGKDWHNASTIFKLAEKGAIETYTSSSSLINIMYAMSSYKLGRADIVASTLAILSYTKLIDPDNITFEMALLSSFKDLEDAVQYHTALEIKGINYFIKSNIKDYKGALPELPVITASEYINKHNRHI